MKPRLIGLMLIAAFALTAATTASAFSSFRVTKIGTIKLTGEGEQIFKYTDNGAKSFTCTGLTGTGFQNALLAPSVIFLAKYTGCEAFGGAITITTGEILYDANGSVRFPNTDKFVLTFAAGKCSVLWQSEGESTIKLLGTVKYENVGAGVKSTENPLTGITLVVNGAKGSFCGEPGVVNGASYTGTATTSLEGGTIKVQ